MKKNSYWFRHDANAGRGLRLRKIQHIHDHWGKGVYWDVVEILREQSGYQYPADDASLNLLCDLIGCRDFPRFKSWFEDCIKADLLRKNEVIERSESGVNSVNFTAPGLSESMKYIDKQRANGLKGGRPELQLFEEIEVINPNETQTKPKRNPGANPKQSLHTDTHTDKSNSQSFFIFNNFRIAYPGKKRGNETEFANFKKKHKDWQLVLPTLLPAVTRQKESRAHKKSIGGFVPEWKNLPTWINQRCWEEEVELPPSKEDKKPEVTHKEMFPQVD